LLPQFDVGLAPRHLVLTLAQPLGAPLEVNLTAKRQYSTVQRISTRCSLVHVKLTSTPNLKRGELVYFSADLGLALRYRRLALLQRYVRHRLPASE
jgi:hypothetical protein